MHMHCPHSGRSHEQLCNDMLGHVHEIRGLEEAVGIAASL